VLHHAVEEIDSIILRKLLEDFGADPHIQQQPHKNTPLMIAVKMPSRLDSLNILLEHGVDPNITDSLNFTPIHIVVMQLAESWDKWMSQLDDENDNDYCCPTVNNYFTCIKLLVKHGADLSTVMCIAPESNGRSHGKHLLDSVIKFELGWPMPKPIHIPNFSGAVTSVISKEDDVYESNRLKLIFSQIKELLCLLFSNGLQIATCYLTHQLTEGLSALLYHFCHYQWTELVTLLLNHGAIPRIMMANHIAEEP